MIVIKNTQLDVILRNIDVEKTYLNGLKDSIGMIQSASPEVQSEVFNYVRHNAVFNSIAEKAKREISSRFDIFQTMAIAIDNAIALLNDITQRLKSANIKVYDNAVITFRQKGMFDWINAINFFGNYSGKFIDVSLTQPKTVNNYLTKADFEFINKTANYYNILLKRLSDSQRNLKNSINMLSDELYSEDNENILTSMRGKAATTTGLAPHLFNPDYWRRYLIMRSDVRTLKSNHEKIDMYAMKLQKLENKRNNTQDPTIDRQIEYWQNEIQILDAEIAEIEAKYREDV